MECLIVRPEDVDRDTSTLLLRDVEAHHAVRSLRLRTGDELLASDLAGTCYRCSISDIHDSTVQCSIDEALPGYGEPTSDILLIQALISQPARWEFLLEKATELGVRAIQPVTTERTERSDFKQERSERILRAAVKQTKRARMPQLREVVDLKTALSSAVKEGRSIALLHEEAPGHQKLVAKEFAAIVVGPEGGFTDAEVEMARSQFGATVVSLGPRRLRAETAALAALAVAIDH